MKDPAAHGKSDLPHPVIIRLARSAGFCFGVRRAIDIALKAAASGKSVYMLGDIVHNESVVAQIQRAGIRTVEDIGEIGSGTLLLRAHGTIPEIYRLAAGKGLEVVDATCPMVLEIHRLARELEAGGYRIIIVGDQNHDEVRGIAAQVHEARVVSRPGDLDSWPRVPPRVGVVVQSTQNIENVQAIMSCLVGRCREIRFINTICNPTTHHQNEIRRMPRENDVMIIVGSYTSANTRRLTELSLAINPRTYQVQSASELRPEWFGQVQSVGISAGASTPDEVIDEVIGAIMEIRPGSVLDNQARRRGTTKTGRGEGEADPSGPS